MKRENGSARRSARDVAHVKIPSGARMHFARDEPLFRAEIIERAERRRGHVMGASYPGISRGRRSIVKTDEARVSSSLLTRALLSHAIVFSLPRGYNEYYATIRTGWPAIAQSFDKSVGDKPCFR